MVDAGGCRDDEEAGGAVVIAGTGTGRDGSGSELHWDLVESREDD